MTALVYLELADGAIDDVSRQAISLARALGDGPLHAVVACSNVGPAVTTEAGSLGVVVVHVSSDPAFETHAPCAAARALATAAHAVEASVVVGPGTERGNEVLAHLAAILDLPLAANCVAVTAGAPLVVTRVRWGGSLLEEARVHGEPALLTVQPHAVPATTVGDDVASLEQLDVELSDADRAIGVVEHVSTSAGGVSLAEARVVVTGGRGVGSAEGFAPVEELAALLGGAVGCSRAVTMAGWRPHTDQVGQTGTKIAPELYVACGVSGATQHIAGCKGAKRILAVNTDPEAPIMSVADYAVIGDLHEVLPAVSAVLRAGS